ncbi:MAG: hypothetical protein QXY26_09140 [Ignisphaera sp.]
MVEKSLIDIGSCIICGRPAPLIDVRGRRIAICVDCIPLLDSLIHPLAEKITSMAKPAKVKVAKTLTPEQFKEKVIQLMEKKGKVSVTTLGYKWGIKPAEARQIAETLANEKGYAIRKVKDRIILEKPTPPPAAT